MFKDIFNSPLNLLLLKTLFFQIITLLDILQYYLQFYELNFTHFYKLLLGHIFYTFYFYLFAFTFFVCQHDIS